MSEKDVRPSTLMKSLEKHNQSFASMSKAARRVKIEQNHTWRLRLLPVEMGPDKEPFVEIAQHWWNKAPVTCPRHTGTAWGGNPDFPCPVCELSERLNESSDEQISGIGYRIRCNLRIRSWCIVFDMEDQRGNVDDLPISEILNPYEFDMFKTTWEQFAKYQKWAISRRRSGQEPSEWGMLDLETGCDLLATQGAKGVTLDRSDPGPIFPTDDPNYDKYIEKIWSRTRKPQIVIPTEKQLLELAVKIEEYTERGGNSGGGGGGGRSRGRGRGDESSDDYSGRGRNTGRGRDNSEDSDDGSFRGRGRSRRSGEDQDEESLPPRSNSRRFGSADEAQEDQGAPASAPTRRRTPEPQAQTEEAPAPPTRRSAPPAQQRDPEPEAEQQEAQEEAPAPPTRRQTPASPPAARRPAPEKEDHGGVTPEDMDQDQEQPAGQPTPPPPARRGTVAPAAPPSARRRQPEPEGETEAAPAANGEDNDGDVAPQRPPARRQAPPQSGGVDEEEDNAPEEKRDPAPPTRETVDDAPPAVSATAPAAKRAVGSSSDIKNRLDRLTGKGR